MKYALPIICLFIVFTSPALSQDAINAGVYYPPSKAINYPFLASTSVSTASAGISTINNHTAGNTACCAPLLPTIAQGIRDTFSAIFPCRGIRRQAGQGLLFSARFLTALSLGEETAQSLGFHLLKEKVLINNKSLSSI